MICGCNEDDCGWCSLVRQRALIIMNHQNNPLSQVLKAALEKIGKSVEAEREACAKVAEAQAQEFLSPEYATGQPLSSHAERFACAEVAKAIRARSNPST